MSSTMGRLLKLEKPVSSYDHFYVANWRRFVTKFWTLFDITVFITTNSTNSRYILVNYEFLASSHSAVFWVDLVDWEYIRSGQKKGENIGERLFNWFKKIKIQKFKVGLRTLRNISRSTYFTDDGESQFFWYCPFF